MKKIAKHSRESEERIGIEVRWITIFVLFSWFAFIIQLVQISIHRQLLDVRNVVPLLAAIATDQITYLVFPFYKRGSVGDDLLRRRPRNDHLAQAQVSYSFHFLVRSITYEVLEESIYFRWSVSFTGCAQPYVHCTGSDMSIGI